MVVLWAVSSAYVMVVRMVARKDFDLVGWMEPTMAVMKDSNSVAASVDSSAASTAARTAELMAPRKAELSVYGKVGRMAG